MVSKRTALSNLPAAAEFTFGRAAESLKTPIVGATVQARLSASIPACRDYTDCWTSIQSRCAARLKEHVGPSGRRKMSRRAELVPPCRDPGLHERP